VKIIGAILGTAAVRTSPDDVMPHGGILQRDLAAFSADLYRFNVKPVIQPGMPPAAVLVFQSGEFMSDEGKIPIIQLAILPDGYAVTTQTTDPANIVLTDFLAQLDSQLGYRFAEASPRRLCASALVAEFSDDFVNRNAAFSVIQETLNRSLNESNDHPYALKRLAFSHEPNPEIPGILTSINQAVSPDFTIERRANEPMARNRFFCTAPTTTTDHERLLKEIERAVVELPM
jgi:hypothetical protein